MILFLYLKMAPPFKQLSGTKWYQIVDFTGWLGLPRWNSGKESALLQKQERKIWSLGLEDPLEEEMSTHSIIFAEKIFGTALYDLL